MKFWTAFFGTNALLWGVSYFIDLDDTAMIMATLYLIGAVLTYRELKK